nr:hypothetical protein [uncultured Rhodoferax sp.]
MQSTSNLRTPAAANVAARSLAVSATVAQSVSTNQRGGFAGLLLRRDARSDMAISSTSTRSFARSRFFFSFNHPFARIFTYVLIAPMTITPATAQYSSVGTCTAAISSPYFEAAIFAYALLASALMHFVLLPLQRLAVAYFSGEPT